MADLFFRNWHHFKQIIRFLISGGTAALINLIILYAATDFFKVWYLFSTAISYAVSFLAGFFLQKFWTFNEKDAGRIKKQMAVYFFIAAMGFCINLSMMYLLVDILHVWYMFSQAMIGAVLAGCNFLLYKFLVFNRGKIEYERT